MKLRHFIVPAYLLLCLLLGGASAAGYLANLLLQLTALPLIGWSLWSLQRRPVLNPSRSLLLIALLLVVIMLVQLVPMPPAVWSALPGRGPVVEGYRMLGIPLPWLPLSLSPTHTLASLLWLLPAFAVLLATVALGAFRARWIAFVLVGVTVASVALGTLQLVGGDDSPAYLYAITNFGVAVGFFANANHAASLLLVTTPFLAALQAQLTARQQSPQRKSAITVMTGAGFLVIIVGLLTNGSLAGIGLGVPIALASFFFVIRQSRPAWWAQALIGVACAATLAAIVVGPFHNNLVGKQRENVDLSRQTSFALTLRAAREYLPIGSGIGTFQEIYHTQEPVDRTTDTYMNHAHSDWLEIILETGVIGLIVAGVFLTWWVRRAIELFRLEEPDFYGRAAVIASAALMLHSLVDYPLRTAALSAVFAMCAGLMARARPHAAPSRARKAAGRHIVA